MNIPTEHLRLAQRLHLSLVDDLWRFEMGYLWSEFTSGWFYRFNRGEPVFDDSLPGLLGRLRQILKAEVDKAPRSIDTDWQRSADKKLARALKSLAIPPNSTP